MGAHSKGPSITGWLIVAEIGLAYAIGKYDGGESSVIIYPYVTRPIVQLDLTPTK